MVIRNVVPASIAGNAVHEIAAFAGADLRDSTTWYGRRRNSTASSPWHHVQSPWDVRQCPALHALFTEFFGTPRLIVDINPRIAKRFRLFQSGVE
jgi:hypothetical protein